MTPTEIMLDLETGGKNPGCVILSIGAVAFKPFEPEIVSEFYVNICPDSCVAAGLTWDENTRQWWSEQGDAARNVLDTDRQPLAEALEMFADWKADYGAVPIWGNGASFDPPIMEAAYEAVGLPTPWHFYHQRCFRTMKALTKNAVQAPDFAGVKHYALDDARHQAVHLQSIFARLKVTA